MVMAKKGEIDHCAPKHLGQEINFKGKLNLLGIRYFLSFKKVS